MKVYLDSKDEFQDYFVSDYKKGAVLINRYVCLIKVNFVLYSIIGVHYHSPSEHTLNGEKYDLEIHLVGKNQDEEHHVFAIF